MSLQKLLESANPYKSLQSDAARLASKWARTGLLKGLNEDQRNHMSLLLESQAKQLVMESSQTGGGTGSTGAFTSGVGEQWAGVALPLVRKVFGSIAAQEFVSVQPMNLPSGLVFYLDFQYGTNKTPFSKGDSVYGDSGSNAPFGNTDTGGFYGAGRFGYSTNNTSSVVTATTSSANWSDVGFDSDFSASATGGELTKVQVAKSELSNLDEAGVRGFVLSGTNLTVSENNPQFTSNSADNVTWIISGSDADTTTANEYTVEYQLQPTDRYRGDFEDGNDALTPGSSQISIPEINVEMRSSAIVAKTKKLKAVWTPEFAQDLNAYQSLDAEAELTSILSDYISLEIDLEILDMLIDGASAGTEIWSAVNNQSIIDNEGNGTISDLGFYNSQGQWFQTLGTKIQKLSNVIHQKTLRGGANFMVISPTVSTIIESIPGFASNHTGDVTKSNYAFGVQKSGTFGSGQYKVYKNPYMKENTILLGFRGSQFLESGAVFAPYIPLIMTPLVYDPDTFTPRKGLLTRYAKKLVRPEFYGIVKVSGLNTL